jgi:hypothetical protein
MILPLLNRLSKGKSAGAVRAIKLLAYGCSRLEAKASICAGAAGTSNLGVRRLSEFDKSYSGNIPLSFREGDATP